MCKMYKLSLLCFLLALLQGCSAMRTMADAKTLKPEAGKLIVVGKFELDPPLIQPGDDAGHKPAFIGAGKYVNKAFFSATAKPVDRIDDSMRSSQWNNTLDATWGETYFKETDARKTYLNAGVFFVDVISMDQAWLPAGMSFTPPANAKAIYIGTVRYTRDDFMNITKVQVIDEYREAKAEFEKSLGKTVRLQKVLLRKAN